MAGPLAALLPLVKVMGAQGGRAAITTAAKGVAKNIAKDAVKDKAKSFVTGKGKKKKGKKGKGGALVKSEGGEQKQEGTGGGAIVATTPMVGNYRVETPPEKPDIEGKQSKISFESINNQLDSVAGLTEALKKTSQARLKTAVNKKKAERKAAEKAKKRQRENLLEKGAGFLGGVASSVTKALPFDPLKFFTMILLGSLLLWIMQNGSKIIGFLKGTLAFMNALGKLILKGIKALGSGLKAALKFILKGIPGVGKAAKAIKNLFKAVGNKLKGAFNAIGSGLKNMAKGLIKKLKDLGKFIMNPQGKKPPKGTPKGLKQAVKPGQLTSNAARTIKLKHGTEAAERFQRLVDKGMDPAKASRKVNKAIKAGKIVSKPAKAAAKAGSKVAQKAGEKSLITVGKGALKFLKRIPVIGGLITLVVSLLGGDPVSQALFKTGGAVLGGFLGSFIPIPVIGTLLGELVGEYIGDLMYHLLMGGGPAAVGKKLQEDIKGILKTGKAALDWAGDGFKRLMDGLPKFGPLPDWIPGVGGAEVINPLPLLTNPFMVIPKVYKAFFTRDSMLDGVVRETPDKNEEPEPPKEPEPPEEPPIESIPDIVTPLTGSGAAPAEPDYSQEPTVGVRPRASRGSGFAGPLFDLIASGEGNYNSINRGRAGDSPGGAKKYLGRDLTSMTVGEIMNLQAQEKVYAVGKYQIVPGTMKDFVARGGVNKSDLYDGPTQEKFPRYVLYTKRPTVGKYLDGKAPLNDAIYALAAEFASIGVPEDTPARSLGRIGLGHYPKSFRPKGSTLYGGTSNFAHTGPDKIASALQQIKGGGSQSTAQTTSSATTPQVQPTTPMAESSPLEGQGQRGAVTPTIQMIPQQATGPALGGLKGHSGSVAYNGQQNAPLSVSYSPFSQSDISSQGMKIISGRGYRASTGSVHKGLDIPSVAGTPVYAYLPGKITQNRTASGYGNLVEWQDSIYGEKHMFAHLQAPSSLKVGQEFPAGTMLARTGDTGSPGSFHLHWEIGAQGAEKDPSKWVAAHPNTGEVRTRPQSSASQVTPTTTGTTRTGGGSVTTGSGSATVVTRSSTAGSGSISAISSQLAYETPGGGGVIMLAPTADNRNMVVGSSGGGAGTPVIMGSGDVVNSYHKAQLLGFLYKQG